MVLKRILWLVRARAQQSDLELVIALKLVIALVCSSLRAVRTFDTLKWLSLSHQSVTTPWGLACLAGPWHHATIHLRFASDGILVQSK